jgi:hypothetical protein
LRGHGCPALDNPRDVSSIDGSTVFVNFRAAADSPAQIKFWPEAANIKKVRSPIEQSADGKERRNQNLRWMTCFAAIFHGAGSIPIQVSGKSRY